MKGPACCWFAPAAFLLDRATKEWAMRAMDGSVVLWPGMLRFVYVENTGAAFGLFKEHTGWLAVLTAVALAGLVVFLLKKGRDLPVWPRAALWLMTGGALGNLFDRIVYGCVVDFIEVLFFRFPVFNVADICVCTGFAIMAVWILLSGKGEAGARDKA